MPVSYETDPQSNIAWLTGRLTALEKLLATIQGDQRVAAGRGGVVVPNAASQTLSQALSPATGVTLSSNSSVVRRGSLVVIDLELSISASIAQFGALVTLPAGFRPMAQNSGDYRFGDAANGANGWAPFAYFINSADFTLRTLSGSLANGNTASIHKTFRAVA